MRSWLLLTCLCLGCAGKVAPVDDSTATGGTGGLSTGGAGSLGGGATTTGGAPSTGGGSAGGTSSGGATATGGTPSTGGIDSGGTDASGGSPTVGVLTDYLGNPDYPDSFWVPATFEEAHMDASLIEGALEKIATSEWEIHSLLIARNGKLVVDRYGYNQGTNPAVPGTPHQTLPSESQALWSATKSFLSALYGIAIREGYISSVDELVQDWFPDYADLNPSPEKDVMKLADLLTMRSGLDLTEPEPILEEAPNAARAALALTMLTAPGEKWNYSSGNSSILAEILRTSTGATPLEFAEANLFGPLGIQGATWLADQSGTQHGGFGLSMTAREMARFGELYRNRGFLGDVSLVPEEWTDDSISPRCTTDWGGEYAYHWWVPEPELPGFFNALGAFGQFIYVSRDLGLVIVVTSERPNETAKNEIQGLIGEYIVPAAE